MPWSTGRPGHKAGCVHINPRALMILAALRLHPGLSQSGIVDYLAAAHDYPLAQGTASHQMANLVACGYVDVTHLPRKGRWGPPLTSYTLTDRARYDADHWAPKIR